MFDSYSFGLMNSRKSFQLFNSCQTLKNEITIEKSESVLNAVAFKSSSRGKTVHFLRYRIFYTFRKPHLKNPSRPSSAQGSPKERQKHFLPNVIKTFFWLLGNHVKRLLKPDLNYKKTSFLNIIKTSSYNFIKTS